MKPAYLDRSSAAEFVALSESTMDKLLAREAFPKPRQLTEKRVGWLVRELEEWAESRTRRHKDRYSNEDETKEKAFHLYRHFDSSGTLLYVGVSLSALNRLAAHESGSHWYWRISRVEVTNCKTRQESLDAEVDAIVKEKPLFNIVHNKHGVSNEPTHN